MKDYSEVYLETMKSLRNFYNYEVKEDHVAAAKAATEASLLANQLKDIANDRARV
jgi:hypothetical protein